MAAFNPEELTDQEAQELARVQHAVHEKGRPSRRPSPFTAQTCATVPVSAGFCSSFAAEVEDVDSPNVKLTQLPPGVTGDFAPVMGTGSGTTSEEASEMKFIMKAEPCRSHGRCRPLGA